MILGLVAISVSSFTCNSSQFGNLKTMTKTRKVIAKKCNIRRRKSVKKTVEQWTQPEYSSQEELEMLESCLVKFGYCLVILMTFLASYSLMYNTIREKSEGSSRACAKLCEPYISFDLFDVIGASYPLQSYPNYWSLPNPARDSLLKEKACRTPSQLSRDRRHRIMGTSQSTDAENANVEKIVGSETKYSLFDLSAWKGSSVATLLLLMAVLCGILLIALKKYRNLRKIARANVVDMEGGRRRGDVEMLDMVKLGNYLRSPTINNSRAMDVCCPLDLSERTKTCSNKLHLALESEARKKVDNAGKE